MSGATGLALGAFTFEALGFSYQGIQRKLTTSWASVPVAGRMDDRQWLGPEKEEIVIKGVLFPESFGGEASLNGLREAAREGEPLMLAAQSGDVHGYHVIEEISEDQSYHDRYGQPRRNAYQITLSLYEGVPKASRFNSFISYFS